MEPVYKSPTHMALMFDSPNEHRSYFIKWSIGKSLSANVEILRSTTFKAGYVEFNDAKKQWFNWRLEYRRDDETKSTKISLIRMDNDDPLDVPILCRMGIVNKGTDITKDHVSAFLHSTIKFRYNFRMSLDNTRDLDLPNGDYLVYLYLDLPTDVFVGEPPSPDRRSYFGAALLLSCIASLFDEVISSKTNESKGTSDIVLTTEKGEPEERRFYCHRAILSVRSPVFDTMLRSEFKESNDRDVEIKDIDGDAMEIVLQFMYTGVCPSDMPVALIPGVINGAEKYMLLELKDECVRQLFGFDDNDEAWADRLAMADTYNIDYLKKMSMLALSTNARVFGERVIREKLSDELMTELADMVAKRWMRSTTMEVKN